VATSLSIVVAASENNVIGVRNELPWRLPDDLRRFKALTMGKPILMGRKTFESIGKPLPGRTNLVVTRQQGWVAAGCVVASSIAEAIERADAPEVMVIGGAQIYAEVLPAVNTIHLTRVHTIIEGDAHFPKLASDKWIECSKEYHSADERHAYAFTFVTLQHEPLTANR
jgi:dihydrofolate reductase